MWTPPTGPKAREKANVDFAVERLNAGDSSETVCAALVERGMTPAEASELVNGLLVQGIYSDAIGLLNQGHTPEQVKQILTERGLKPETANTIVSDILARARASQGGGNPVFQVLGGVVFAVGVLLFIGNVSGVFRTFPLAGFITMAIGGAIMGAGRSG